MFVRKEVIEYRIKGEEVVVLKEKEDKYGS